MKTVKPLSQLSLRGRANRTARAAKRITDEEVSALMSDVAKEWLEHKRAEADHRTKRRKLELIMKGVLGIDKDDKTFGEVAGAFAATGLVVARHPRKIHRPLFEQLCERLGLNFKKLTTQPREREVVLKEWGALTDVQKTTLGLALDFTNCSFNFGVRSLLDS